MDEKQYILTTGEGESKREYQILKTIRMGERLFFVVLSLTGFDVMFGEYLGESSEDPEENLERVYQDFLNGCKHITYADGHIEDELYEIWDEL